jgi:hypothetical protein
MPSFIAGSSFWGLDDSREESTCQSSEPRAAAAVVVSGLVFGVCSMPAEREPARVAACVGKRDAGAEMRARGEGGWRER